MRRGKPSDREIAVQQAPQLQGRLTKLADEGVTAELIRQQFCRYDRHPMIAQEVSAARFPDRVSP